MRSRSPVRIFITGESAVNLPATTFTNVNFPIKGSTTVLNTIAAVAASSFNAIYTGLPSMSTPISEP